MPTSQIMQVSTGFINTVNDAVVGMPTAPGGLGLSKFAGQLGRRIEFEDADIHFNSAVGTVYGGGFQYVRLAAAATAVVVGQIVFWDYTVAQNLYQVTTSEAESTDGAVFRAGIVLNPSWTPGNYSFVQYLGPTFVRFRGTLTAAGAIGSRVFAAAAGAGVDNGFADVIDSSSPTEFSDVSKMMGRYIGTAIVAPTSGGLKLVNQNWTNASL